MRNAIERLRAAVNEAGGNKAATAVMSNLAEAIQGLVNQMRAEQQTIRDWVEGQARAGRAARRNQAAVGEDRARGRQFMNDVMPTPDERRFAPACKRRRGERQRVGRMALARTRRGESGMNYWPGFVDALSTLILSIIFLLSVFVVVQFYLQQEVQGKSAALQRLNAQITGLAEQLSMAKSDKADLESQLAGLQASLAGAQSDRDKFQALYRGAAADAAAAQGQGQRAIRRAHRRAERPRQISGALSGRRRGCDGGAKQGQRAVRAARGEKDISAKALAQVETLNTQLAALRQQLAALNTALDASEQKDAQSQQQITDLGQRLNVALAKDVQELSSYRSDFFGKLRTILGNRPDMRIVGDRFVLQSEVFFDTSRADLKPEGRAELDKVAGAIVELESQIPPDLAWVLRVDGHTDVRPISGGQFKSNWDLSAARAHCGGAISDRQGRPAGPAGRRRLRPIRPDRHRHHRGRLPPQPPHRVQAHRALILALQGSRRVDRRSRIVRVPRNPGPSSGRGLMDDKTRPDQTGYRFIGKPMPRKEDARLVTGKGRFTDDFSLDGQAYAAMVRSPYPHARIVAIDAARAKAMPGVLGVFTGADCAADGSQAHPARSVAEDQIRHEASPRRGGGAVFIGPHLLLPADKARHVGEAVAMVVAETKAQAMDAAEAVEVAYEELPFVLHSEDAMRARRAGDLG